MTLPDKGWSRTFFDPIPLPNGGELRILSDAGNYIANLPKREHHKPGSMQRVTDYQIGPPMGELLALTTGVDA